MRHADRSFQRERFEITAVGSRYIVHGFGLLCEPVDAIGHSQAEPVQYRRIISRSNLFAQPVEVRERVADLYVRQIASLEAEALPPAVSAMAE